MFIDINLKSCFGSFLSGRCLSEHLPKVLYVHCSGRLDTFFWDGSSLRKVDSGSALCSLQAIDLKAIVLEIIVSYGVRYDDALCEERKHN